MNTFGVWKSEDLNQLKAEVIAFFSAYYSELRRIVEESEPETLPAWIKGVRLVHTYACKDGVLIAHIYTDNIPSGLSTELHNRIPFRFEIRPNSTVNDLYWQLIPPRLGGGKFPVHANPKPGERFGKQSFLRPLSLYVPLSKEKYLQEDAERLWSRLDYADLYETVVRGRWKSTELAKEEAELALEFAREDRESV